MSAIRRAAALTAAASALAAVAGCGFVAASDKPMTKPNSFVLSGHADVALPADDHRAAGTVCVAPAAAADVAVTAFVTITDANGAKIAHGSLGQGVVARTGDAASCNFPFRIYGVPGGGSAYGVVIADRPAVTFAGSDLTQNRPAIITIAA